MSNAMLLYAHLSDNELIEKMKGGNKLCFEVIIRRHSQSLYRTGRAFSMGHNDVEDMLHNAFSASFQRLPRFNGRYSFRLWLLKNMIETCMQKSDAENSYYTNQSFDPAGCITSQSVATTDRIFKDKTAVNLLENCIEKLPQALRTAFVLSEIEGLSLKEVAGLLRISESAAKSSVNKAKLSLNKTSGIVYYHTDVYPFYKSYCDMLVDRVMSLIDAHEYHIEKALVPKF